MKSGHVWAASVVGLLVTGAWAQAIGLPKLSDETQECITCHRKSDIVVYQQWGDSKHFRANVGCYECHAANKGDPDAMDHYGFTVSTLVTPKDCARCHSKETTEFVASHHSKGARILGSLDNTLAEVVEGSRGFKTVGFPEGVSAAAVNGCWQCHGSQIKVLAGGKLDPATWPNSGIGRINPDGSEGSCNACHTRHAFSVAQARHPNTCGKCHLGPDHPQKEVYEESKHGILFFANLDKMNMGANKWIVGEDYWAAPACVTCHMSATRTQAVTHDIGLRISWNNRPAISIRTDEADAKMGLPGKDVPWQVRRKNMQDVCLNCHAQGWVDGFYAQYDALIEQYHEKFARPGLELYNLAKPLRDVQEDFSHAVDWAWYEIWHHEGRRARHGASMMAPDYTHWHGTYEVAKKFYTEFLPELEELIHKGAASGDEQKVKGAAALKAKLDDVLNRDEHKWFVGKLSPEEKAKRKEATEEFKKRYTK